ncbi:DUF2712 domain-containing protein [Bacteroidota bacterium]
MRIKLILIGLVTALIGTSCENGNEVKISKNNSNESHNMGKNCMSCHIKGSDGEGWFTVAGTVYDSASTTTNPNGSVKLYTGANGSGSLVATIEVDQHGNFYTTENIDLSAGVYPVVTSENGSMQYMPNAVNTGQCNSCHGVINPKIYVNE